MVEAGTVRAQIQGKAGHGQCKITVKVNLQKYGTKHLIYGLSLKLYDI